MLQIMDIKKTYVTGELVQTALAGVSLNLRDNEFVAILGPSGSGKTTLLNVIGGLDRYDSGDLVINGISTKKYTDRDWDSYRNHTIGFVFQSYNLIPHQSVLANVELALTISGISKKERRRRAAKALEDVGLGNQLHKKPNQMSGGQMQRVAIARALVNDPDILLADEPTGALDSETSVQVMELLKEVSRKRLVVMVTHNPELAEEYANRIVRVKDGKIIGDTNPFLLDADTMAPPEHKNMGKSSMSFFTSMALSFNNLRTKKARTLLTAFAGSIGIIGIALIMSLSTGFQLYIDKIQADTLSNYPLSIQTETSDMGSMFSAFGASLAQAREADEGVVVEQQVIAQMFAQIGTNDLKSFKKHLDTHMDEIDHAVSTIKYSYGIQPRIYLADTSERILQANPGTLFNKILGNSLMASLMGTDIFYEMIDNREMLESQYEVLQGRWPEHYNEMIVVLSDPSQITDMMAYTLGLKAPELLDEIMDDIMSGEVVEEVSDTEQWTYEDLMGVDLRLVDVTDLYRYNEEYEIWEDMSEDKAHMEKLIAEGDPLKIVGIVCAKEGANATALSAGVAYTSDLTRNVIRVASDSALVKAQQANPEVDVFSNSRFDEEKESELNFQDMISVDSAAISSAFGMNIDSDHIVSMLRGYLEEVMKSTNTNTAPAQAKFYSTLDAMARDMLAWHIRTQPDGNGGARLSLAQAESIVAGYMETDSAKGYMQDLANAYPIPMDAYTNSIRPLLEGLITTYIAQEFSSWELTSLPSSASAPPEGFESPQTDDDNTGGNNPGGDNPGGDNPGGNNPGGDNPGGDNPGGDNPGGDNPGGDNPGGDNPGGDNPGGDNPGGDNPGGDNPGGDNPGGDDPDGDDPDGDDPDGDNPDGDNPDGDDPDGNDPDGDDPDGGNPDGDDPDGDDPDGGNPDGDDPDGDNPDGGNPDDDDPDGDPDDDGNNTLDMFAVTITPDKIDGIVSNYMSTSVVSGAAAAMGTQMMESTVQTILAQKIAEFGTQLAKYIQRSFYVNGDRIANAFKFEMTEEEISRLMMAMSGQGSERSAAANLRTLGYADLEVPTSMSVYLVDFAAKEEFIAFLDAYNEAMTEAEQEDQVIQYTDMTGMMMSSVRTIIDSVSYALIAFVAVSLVVSSIMIGIITYISVMERTKEIGILRAIGASKRNISQVFNAETFIIGLLSGILGIGITLLLLIPGNMLIQHFTDNPDIVAQLPTINAVILIALSVLLTLIGGFIPSKQAAKKDPVIALRSE